MKTKPYHFEIGRLYYGFRSAVYEIANYAGVSVLNFDQRGFLAVNYYFTIQGSEENLNIFEKNLAKSLERLKR